MLGAFSRPGFIDTHDHVESSMVDMSVLPMRCCPGTTTIACDNHEITNVFGVRAVELFHKASQGLPLKVMVAMPVCVPSIPGFEDAGSVITWKEVAKGTRRLGPNCRRANEFPGIDLWRPSVHAITAASLKAGKVLTGTTPRWS